VIVDQHINFVSKFFLFCSGVSLDVIKKCPRFEITKYTSIGLTICFTALLAIISSFFAFSLIFEDLTVIIGASLLWGAIIFNLDRYIISSMRSSNSKYNEFIKAIPRLIIAIIIGVIISKPLEIKIFKNEISSYLSIENSRSIAAVENKYSADFERIAAEKKEIDDHYTTLLMLRERYYEDFKCECDGTCGTKKKGRGIECFSKKEKYEIFLSEILDEKTKRDSTLAFLAQRELSMIREIESQKKVLAGVTTGGLIDQIRALNEIDKMSSMFIIFIFVMIETAPILTKLLSSKGPYDNLILEYEREFEINYLKAMDNLDHERLKNQKLKEMSARFEIKSKETQIQNIVKQEALERYEKIRNELENKISEN